MKVYAINGSPRKDNNTSKMLHSFIDGVKSVGDFEIEYIDLYDLDYKGCASCFGCQLNDENLFGYCHRKDDISKILKELPQADGVVLGSPIYLGTISSTMHTFLERLSYQFIDFSGTKSPMRSTNAPKPLVITSIYTMNINEERMIESGTLSNVLTFENCLAGMFMTEVERICAFNTYQYDDYSKYRVGIVDESAKRQHRDSQFDIDLKTAFNGGQKMAEKIINSK